MQPDTRFAIRESKHIPDDLFLAAVAATMPMNPGSGCWRYRRDVHATLQVTLGTEIPEKLFLAKARRLGRRRLLEGCTSCTCRGDYHLPRECRRYRCCYGPDEDWATHPGYDPSWENDPPPDRDPDAFTKALAYALAALGGKPDAAVPGPFDLSQPARLVYPGSPAFP